MFVLDKPLIFFLGGYISATHIVFFRWNEVQILRLTIRQQNPPAASSSSSSSASKKNKDNKHEIRWQFATYICIRNTLLLQYKLLHITSQHFFLYASLRWGRRSRMGTAWRMLTNYGWVRQSEPNCLLENKGSKFDLEGFNCHAWAFGGYKGVKSIGPFRTKTASAWVLQLRKVRTVKSSVCIQCFGNNTWCSTVNCAVYMWKNITTLWIVQFQRQVWPDRLWEWKPYNLSPAFKENVTLYLLVY